MGGWKGANSHPEEGVRRVVAWLVRQRSIFGEHRRYCSARDFPEAFRTYIELVSDATDDGAPSQVVMLRTAKNFETVYGRIKEKVHSFDHLASWDFIVYVYSHRSLPSGETFDFEPGSFHLEDATGPKEGWQLVLLDSNQGVASPEI